MEGHTCGFANCGSFFGQAVEAMLKLVIVGTDDPSEIFCNFVGFSVPEYLKHLELDGFGISKVLAFKPREHLELRGSQRRFLRRLQDVLYCRLELSSRSNGYIRDLVDILLRKCGFDDGSEFYMRHSNLALRVGSQEYNVLSDREGKQSGGLTSWILQETKLKFDARYRQGDVHLAAAMVAACQSNDAVFSSEENARGVVYRKEIFGIKVSGDEFFFYRIEFGKEYLEQLAGAGADADVKPTNNLVMHKYPLTRGLRISKADDRRKMLCLMHNLREHCLLEYHRGQA